MKITLLSFTSLLTVLSIIGLTVTNSHSNSTGTPSPATGSPNDGVTCFQAGCHFGAPSAQAGMITSDIPDCGYTPGTTYTITASIAGNSKKGFQISPQNATGSFLGTLIAGSGQQITNNNHYITHSNFVGASTPTATWNFQWIAPVSGSGPVTFYGAFANSRNTTKTSTLEVQECTVGIDENTALNLINVYPNPATSNLVVTFSTKKAGDINVSLFNFEGKEIAQLANGNFVAGIHSFYLKTLNINSGIYFLSVATQEFHKTEKIVIQ